MPRRGVCIDEGQRRVHLFGEVLGIAVAPTMFYAATRSSWFSPWQRAALQSIALGTLVIDGYLLARWISR